jgi:hypothetical protein
MPYLRHHLSAAAASLLNSSRINSAPEMYLSATARATFTCFAHAFCRARRVAATAFSIFATAFWSTPPTSALALIIGS